MNFEFNKEKSRINEEKHGVDFVRAQELWKGPSVEFAARSEFENRFAVIGQIGRNLYTCIYTLRDDRIRIISCRRSREKERKLYERNVKKTQNS